MENLVSAETIEAIAINILERFKNIKEGDLTVLLVGKTGAGKSSTINSLFGAQVAPVSKYKPCTMTVECYFFEIHGIRFKIYDTPGLCDDLEEAGKDIRYLQTIKSRIHSVDCVWYVSRLDDNRLAGDEKRAIRLFSLALGPQVWQNSIIIFTHAGKVEREEFLGDLLERGNLMREEIAAHAGSDIAGQIPVLAAENKAPQLLPNGQTWLNTLYIQVFKRISDRGALAFVFATAELLKPEIEILDRSYSRPPLHLRPRSETQTNYTASSSAPVNVYTNVSVKGPHIVLKPSDVEEIDRRFWGLVKKTAKDWADKGDRRFGLPGKVVGAVAGAGVGIIKGIARRFFG